MQSSFDDFRERAHRHAREQEEAEAAMPLLPAPPLRRRWLRAHTTAGMVIALAAHARATGDLSLLDDAEEIAMLLCDRYDAPHARFVVWFTRAVLLREANHFGDASAAFDRAAAEIDAAPPAFAAPFLADLEIERAALLQAIGDIAAARASAWRAAEWYQATGDRPGLRRVAAIVTQHPLR